ncbi:MAG: imidazoleglycerol-phosphate dehydratase HisB [Sulfurospirillum sp.]|nr:imidazoleglycerol-phosphate dehydratase HisB [Sulfurospirillum sp.]MBL0702748.1 imidazoleglycerol-phosphate dehydratase HisB [Sulfurospirillum sp.]
MIKLSRKTKETDIKIELKLHGEGQSDISTGIGFFDHMLETFSKHSLVDLHVRCNGDTNVDFHHSVEDVGIVLGQALKEEIYPIKNIERYSNVVIVMDEAAVESCLDIGNRAYLVYDVKLRGKVGEFDVELVEEFFRAVVNSAGLTLHVECKRGKNKHHILEAIFKSFAIALRRSTVKNDRVGVPSTKGSL